MASREQAIVHAFHDGYSYKEILASLYGTLGIKLSMRQLKRILKKLGLFRRKSNCSFAHLCEVMEREIEKSGSLLGYRLMQQKLRVVHHLQVNRETMREVQKVLDPEGVEARTARRLKRRQYVNKGPNQVWHLDGYDKLKRYGFCIHGCTDGYSRKILWLEVATTNNCPKVVANYFLSYTKELGGTARKIRGDRGTENSNIAGIQRFFRSNHSDSFAGEKSFMYGRSVSNQDFRENGHWDDTDPIQRECLKFCFTTLLQDEMDDIRRIHNTHRIRKSANQSSPNGRPNIIYTLPEIFDTEDFKVNVAPGNFLLAERYCKEKSQFGCTGEFEQIAFQLMAQEDLRFPRNIEEATDLYFSLLDLIDNV